MWYLGCVCFGWKSLPEMRLFGWSEKFYFPENEIRWPKKMPLTTEIDLHFYFPFKAFPENERERESAGAREEKDERDLAIARSRRWSWSRLREIASARDPRGRIWTVLEFFLGCGLCFSRFVFSFFFSKHQKIFFEKFFKMQPNTWKYFPFPEISISEKYVFSGKRFTTTKHSLRNKKFSHSATENFMLNNKKLYCGVME